MFKEPSLVKAPHEAHMGSKSLPALETTFNFWNWVDLLSQPASSCVSLREEVKRSSKQEAARNHRKQLDSPLPAGLYGWKLSFSPQHPLLESKQNCPRCGNFFFFG